MLILFLCTANTGRSALAGALLSRELADRHLLGVGVRSAGRLPGGQAVSPVVADVARAYRADLSAHRSTTVTPGLVGGADLVVAMAAEHAAHALALMPAARRRTFTLRELVGCMRVAGPRQPAGTVAGYLQALDAIRRSTPSPGRAHDVADPYGRPVTVLWRTADELHRLVGALVDHLWPAAPPAPRRP